MDIMILIHGRLTQKKTKICTSSERFQVKPDRSTSPRILNDLQPDFSYFFKPFDEEFSVIEDVDNNLKYSKQAI